MERDRVQPLLHRVESGCMLLATQLVATASRTRQLVREQIGEACKHVLARGRLVQSELLYDTRRLIGELIIRMQDQLSDKLMRHQACGWKCHRDAPDRLAVHGDPNRKLAILATAHVREQHLHRVILSEGRDPEGCVGEAHHPRSHSTVTALDDHLDPVCKVRSLLGQGSLEIRSLEHAPERAHPNQIVLDVLRVTQQRLDRLHPHSEVVCRDLPDQVHQHVAALEQPGQPDRAPGRLAGKELLDDKAQPLHHLLRLPDWDLLGRVRARRHADGKGAHRMVHQRVVAHLLGVGIARHAPPLGIARLA